MLPTANAGTLSMSSVGPRPPEYFRRMVHFNQMDFDHALSQMMHLCTSPEKAFREAKHRKLTKNHWSRDDPAFVMLLLGQILMTCLSYYVALCVPLGLPISTFFKLAVYEVFFNFFVAGILLATLFWFLVNRFLHKGGSVHEVRQTLEWQYALDIHCNAFFAVLMIAGVAQLLLLPWLLKDTFMARALSNLLYSTAFSMYFYISFRGYVELPFLEFTEYFLYPVFFIVLCFTLSLVTTFNSTSWVVNSWLE